MWNLKQNSEFKFGIWKKRMCSKSNINQDCYRTWCLKIRSTTWRISRQINYLPTMFLFVIFLRFCKIIPVLHIQTPFFSRAEKKKNVSIIFPCFTHVFTDFSENVKRNINNNHDHNYSGNLETNHFEIHGLLIFNFLHNYFALKRMGQFIVKLRFIDCTIQQSTKSIEGRSNYFMWK